MSEVEEPVEIKEDALTGRSVIPTLRRLREGWATRKTVHGFRRERASGRRRKRAQLQKIATGVVFHRNAMVILPESTATNDSEVTRDVSQFPICVLRNSSYCELRGFFLPEIESAL